MKNATGKRYESVDSYIAAFPKETQQVLQHIRSVIMKASSSATEIISYNMPAYRQNGVLVYFAGYKNHIGFYPTSSPIRVFKDELVKFKTSKGAIQFPIDQPLPTSLISKIVKYRMKEDLLREASKKK
ncbi:MAG: DUF1801 domain-containing protein [Chitinophagaceae bacterium]|nr:DUF1801 domain-containing protein [Chitinophagaceae bacterium]